MLDADFFKSIFTPSVLGTASLLVMLTSRNGSLSDRLRAATHLICEDKPTMPELRRQNLFEQIDRFYKRYKFNEFAIASLAGALAIFLAMNVFAGWGQLPVAQILFHCGLVCMLFGFILTGADIAYGMGTLDLEVSYAKRTYLPRTANPEAMRQQVVEWMQQNPEWAEAVRAAVHDPDAANKTLH